MRSVARYIHQSAHAHYTTQNNLKTGVEPTRVPAPPASESLSSPSQGDACNSETERASAVISSTAASTVSPGISSHRYATEELKRGQEESNRLLLSIRNVLENLNQVMIGTQHSMARVSHTVTPLSCHLMLSLYLISAGDKHHVSSSR
jgi:precorrin-6B methylase 1